MKTVFSYRYSGVTYFCVWLFGGAKYQGGDEVEAKGTDEQPLSDKPPLTRCGESYKLTSLKGYFFLPYEAENICLNLNLKFEFEITTGSSNLKAQHKVLC